ncbi:AAA family ATPase [Arabiibacter massiliensis]|uniref:AAA family ATPase n=1 Tax=Arabiibacter massiliensis TaxID=1870985 RepID=UPI0009B9E9E4|nr:AAA family ATPase [Arabiibacter massiliensis]
MGSVENPFTPSFGEAPAHLAGRKLVVDNLVRAFRSEQRKPELTTIISGARGTGKTTLLTLLAHKAEERGWITASVTALPGMLDDIEIRVRKQAAHLIDTENGPSLAGIGIPQVIDIRFEEKSRPAGNWRSRMEDLLVQLETCGAGLLITVDEVDVELDEMIQLAAVYQHFVREGRKVALLMAGLPHHISALLSNKTVSFLRRAQTQLGRIADFEIEDALLKTIQENGRSADVEGLKLATEAIGGFPFLMQLVGYRSWDANPESKCISSADFHRGIAVAREELRARILEATFRELSPEDVRFASAMLQDERESRIADLVARLNRSSAQVAQYRKRLIEAGVIGQQGRGVVAFELPYFREYLMEKRENGELG